MSASQLRVNAAELLREPGLRRHVTAIVGPSDVDARHESIAGDLTTELELVSTLDDIALTGTIAVPWQGLCRRCLRPLAESLVVEVDERYAEQPAEHDEAFRIEHGQIDLAPMIREHVLLAVDDPTVVPFRLSRSVPRVRRRSHDRPVPVRQRDGRRALGRPRPAPHPMTHPSVWRHPSAGWRPVRHETLR